MIRIGIVGCGFIGTIHSLALHQLSKANLVDGQVTATFDPDRERAAALAVHHRARVCDELDALLDDVDAVWVCSWTGAHLETVEAASSAGRAIFCEKPLAPTLADCARVADALDQVPHQVGLVLRHAPVFRAAAEAVASGRFGRPMVSILRDDQYFPNQGMYASDWRADASRAGGGTLIEHSVHDVDVLRWLLGDPDRVSAQSGTIFGHAGIDDTTTATFSYPGGSTATLVSVWHQVLSRPSTRRLEVFCEEAMFWTDDDYLGPLYVETSSGTDVVEAPPPAWLELLEMPDSVAKPLAQYAEPAKSFLDALSSNGGEARGFPDAPIALAAHRLVDAAYRSARDGGTPVALA